MNAKKISLSSLNKLLISVFLGALLLYFGKIFLVPMVVAAFFAMLLYPVVHWLQTVGLSKSLAALTGILLLLLVLGILNAIIYYQVTALESDLPELEQKIEEKAHRLQWLFYKTTDIPEQEQEAILAQKKPDILKAIGKVLKNFVVQGLFLLLGVFIVLTYTFFFLVYRHRIQNFFIKVNWFQHHKESREIMHRISQVVHDYLKGTFVVISILAVIYGFGFWAIGIKHALLFALITALLRLIPYFGSFLGIAFPIAFAFLTKDSLWYPVAVLLFFMITQLLEANVLTPLITGAKVKLNPLATIMVILLGSLVWGVPGMVLFVPLFGILKVIFDEIPSLNPYGYILGKEKETF